MSIKSWILFAIIFVVAIFTYDFLTKKPRRAPRWDEVGVHEEYGNWKEFTPQNGKFKVRFPTYPQHTTASDAARLGKSQDVVRYEIYLSQGNGGTTFLLSMLEYPEGFVADDDQLLSAVVRDMVSSNPNSSLVESKTGTFGTHTYSDFTIQTPEFTTKSRVFVDGRTLFVLTVMDKSRGRIHEEFEMFTSSFSLGS